MEGNKKTVVLAKAALFVSALIWGSSFVVMKTSVDVFPPNILLGCRFLIGCIILCVVFHKRLKFITKSYLTKGGLLGILLICAYSFQTIGLTTTSPGKNAFLSAVYCVLVPFIYWFVDKVRPDRYHILAAFLCLAGIGFVSLTNTFSIEMGDTLTLISGFFYGVHMVAVAKITRNGDPILFTIIQFAVATMCAWILGFTFETMPTHIDLPAIFGVLYLAVFATAIALLLQNIGQKYTKPSSASIILSLEAVFGVIFSILFYQEKITKQLAFGFVLIFIAVIISETKLSFLKTNKSPFVETFCKFYAIIFKIDKLG